MASTRIRAALEKQRGGIGITTRVIVYAIAWWALTGGAPASWVWGVPAILVAALFNPFPPGEAWRYRLDGVVRFVPLFAYYSLRSAADVAWRAAHPRRPLNPVLVDYPWQLPPGRARIFMANLINLMPGTLCVGIEERAMTVHILGRAPAIIVGLQRLERHVAALFAVEIPHAE